MALRAGTYDLAVVSLRRGGTVFVARVGEKVAADSPLSSSLLSKLDKSARAEMKGDARERFSIYSANYRDSSFDYDSLYKLREQQMDYDKRLPSDSVTLQMIDCSSDGKRALTVAQRTEHFHDPKTGKAWGENKDMLISVWELENGTWKIIGEDDPGIRTCTTADSAGFTVNGEKKAGQPDFCKPTVVMDGVLTGIEVKPNQVSRTSDYALPK
jgi:hypothetical protein